ncbi:MAG: MMPL family transporter [Actinobacteria bacterium]|jgi:RND superfamily putative drug exporter|nr:MMPL family transporter [Actinomycetota bacterium]
MPVLSAWAVRRPIIALISWFIAVAAVVGLGLTVGGDLNDSFDLPDTESKVATDLLTSSGTDTSRLDSGATIVWSPTTGTAVDEATAAKVVPMLEGIAALPSVACVTNPLDPQGASLGTACQPGGAFDPEAMKALTPEELQTLGSAFSTVSPDGRVAYASVTFAGDGTEVSTADAKAILDEVKALNSDELRVGAQGQVLEFAGQEPPSSEAIGLLVAIIILLIAFGSIVAAGMPIVVALVGLTMGQMAVLVAANFLDVATFAPTLAAMIGLGVGIDYALFVMNRFRQAVLAGRDPKDAAMESVETAGRAVLFAGGTVIIALLGLFVLRINFFNGLSVAAAVTVLMVMLSALWMLPALLSLLGNKALSLRLPWGKKPGSVHGEGKAWAHYGRLLQKRPIIPTLLALAVVVVLAIPMFSLRQGFSDDSGKPEGSPSRIAYDLRAEGFGPGSNGPFVVVADLSDATSPEALGTIVAGLASAEGVAGTSPSAETLPIIGKLQAAAGAQAGAEPQSPVVAIAVYPASEPQDEATTELLQRLREDVNPALEASTGAKLYVGGTQAITSDFTTVLGEALPIFLAIVVGLGFLALMLLFHSLVIPLTAAITSLLSFSAAMGITVAVFQWGWFNDLLRVPGTGPIFPFLPIMVFSILFGLSMDYQVFLVSRMQEEWNRIGDNSAAVRRGLAGSGRVVVIAAAIMSSVFLAFVPATNGTIKLFGVALASAVLIDAFIVRLVLVPSVMSMLGKANWWLPGWLDRILPEVHIEPGEDEIADDEIIGDDKEAAATVGA